MDDCKFLCNTSKVSIYEAGKADPIRAHTPAWDPMRKTASLSRDLFKGGGRIAIEA